MSEYNLYTYHDMERELGRLQGVERRYKELVKNGWRLVRHEEPHRNPPKFSVLDRDGEYLSTHRESPEEAIDAAIERLERKPIKVKE